MIIPTETRLPGSGQIIIRKVDFYNEFQLQFPTYADNVALPAFTRRMLPLSSGHAAIDRGLLSVGSTAANLQTDGWTLYILCRQCQQWLFPCSLIKTTTI